jgi:hypothetical protein
MYDNLEAVQRCSIPEKVSHLDNLSQGRLRSLGSGHTRKQDFGNGTLSG